MTRRGGNLGGLKAVVNSDVNLLETLMTGKTIDGEEEKFTSSEKRKIGKLLEKPVPDRIRQSRLLKNHGNR